MGNPRGFIENRERILPPDRSEKERVSDFKDVHCHIDASEKEVISSTGAKRCMDCGVPFCHFSCPLGNLIPEWNDLASENRWQEAFERLRATNNFPEFTGRLCPALCEQGCVLGTIDPSVTIKNTEVTISDIAFEKGFEKPLIPPVVTGKTVAVVGSGPAGLAAAQQLVRVGHTVVVYEKDAKVGGLLRYGIPNFKLEKEIIDRRIEQMETEGVKFKTRVEIGGNGEEDLSMTDLQTRFDAVIIATGTQIPNDLPIQGRELNNIHFAMDFLTDATKVLFNENILTKSGVSREQITAKDKRVLIIGGGDTGSDCLGTSLRQGAKFVTTLQIMPQPPQKRSDSDFFGEQPWPTYPTLNTKSTSVLEGEYCENSEILYSTTCTKFISDDFGNVKAALLSEVEFKDGKFIAVPGTEREIEVDLVLISVGFKGVEVEKLFGSIRPEMTQRSTIKRSDSFLSSVDKVFVAGDAGRGQSLIVWAIAEGRSVASEVDKFLTQRSILPAPITPKSAPLRG